MLSMQKNPNIDRSLDFITKFASVASTKQPSSNKENAKPASKANHDATDATLVNSSEVTMGDEEEGEDNENPFLTALIDWLIDNLKANCDAVRYRCCNILSKLMAAISNEQFIDEDLYDRLCDGLLERLKVVKKISYN